MLKRLTRYTILLILSALLLIGIFWARSRADDERCLAIDVEIENADSTQFVTREGIIADLKKVGILPIGKPMWQIDADHIERALSHSEYVENVECVKAPNGRILIRAIQIVPVMRIFDGDNSYYINRHGKRMSANANYHTDVPVVQGHFTNEYPPTRLLPLIEYVESDTALRQLVTMYNFVDSDNIYILPAISGHVVNLGSVDNVAGKFDKLRLFYRKVMPEKGWEHYDTISLKWNHQVVATRRQKAVKVEMVYDAEDDEPDIDPEDLKISDETPTLATDKPKNTTRKNN